MQRHFGLAHILVWLGFWLGLGIAAHADPDNPLRHASSIAPARVVARPAPKTESPPEAWPTHVARPVRATAAPVPPPKQPAGAAAAPPRAKEPAQEPPSLTELEALAATAKNEPPMDEATRETFSATVAEAKKWMATLAESAKRQAQFDQDADTAAERLARARAQLANKSEVEIPAVPQTASLAEVEVRSREADAERTAITTQLKQLQAELDRRAQRTLEIPRLIEELRTRLEKEPSAPAADTSVDDRLLKAIQWELKARGVSLQDQIASLKAEARRDAAEAELLPAERDLLKRAQARAEKLAGFWAEVVAQYRQRESEAQAREARRQVQNAHPALKQLAEGNAQLAEQRQRLVDQLARQGRERKTVDAEIARLEEQFEQAKERVEKAGHSTTVGLLLRRQREELPHPSSCDVRMGEIEEAMPRANLALIEIEEAREDLTETDAAIERTLASMRDKIPLEQQQLVEETLRELMQAKVQLLDSLIADYKTYLGALSELEVSNKKLAAQIRLSAEYIGEHVLWIRSTGILSGDDLQNAGRGALQLASPEQWWALATHCGLDMLRRPLIALAVLAFVVTIVVFQSRLRAKIVQLCEPKWGQRGIQFRPTLKAVAISAAVAAEWPLLMAYMGWQMSSADPAQDLTVALGRALLYGACLFWASEFCMQLLRKEGIGEAHFGWSAVSTQALRRELGWLTILGVPLAVAVFAFDAYQEGHWADSLGRMAFIAGMLVLANFVHAILSGKDNVLREAILNDQRNWFERVRRISYFFGVGVPCVLAMVAVVGFYYSAQQVAWRWQGTLGIAMLLLLAYSVAARWCTVRRRSLAMQQLREKRQAAEATEANPTDPLALIPVEEPQLDLSAIHEQLRYLLRHLVTLAMLGALWFVWSDFLPALRVLDRVVLWETMVEVAETTEAASGELQRLTHEEALPTTLRHGLFAGIVVIAAFVLGKYLPALLEVTVLPRLPFDAGGRHAISVLLKYALALTGIFVASQTLHITWSSVQWLAAGMTVGLGFGLQEIFANFVSGLILLFERPIRVGDVITLGDITGKVTNIRIRATTVTNWDRKELIVPNKDLVTGRLLNWTLSDTTNRLVINVGIAYDADPEQARSLILQAVNAHPNILEDPAASVTLEEFGDSSLNLVVRAFLSSMDNRLSTTHELHTEIFRILGSQGIEIPFPQRDLHVRGLEQLGQLTPPTGRREAA